MTVAACIYSVDRKMQLTSPGLEVCVTGRDKIKFAGTLFSLSAANLWFLLGQRYQVPVEYSKFVMNEIEELVTVDAERMA